jgi:hypothetical protein
MIKSRKADFYHNYSLFIKNAKGMTYQPLPYSREVILKQNWRRLKPSRWYDALPSAPLKKLFEKSFSLLAGTESFKSFRAVF